MVKNGKETFLLNVCLLEKDSDMSANGGGAEGRRHRTLSRLWTVSCQHTACHRAQTHKL